MHLLGIGERTVRGWWCWFVGHVPKTSYDEDGLAYRWCVRCRRMIV